MKLSQKTWWQPSWRYETGNSDPVPAAVVTEYGILRRCSIVAGSLIMSVDCKGKSVRGRIGLSVNAPLLDRVLVFLRAYEGDSIESIENLEIEENQFGTP